MRPRSWPQEENRAMKSSVLGGKALWSANAPKILGTITKSKASGVVLVISWLARVPAAWTTPRTCRRDRLSSTVRSWVEASDTVISTDTG